MNRGSQRAIAGAALLLAATQCGPCFYSPGDENYFSDYDTIPCEFPEASLLYSGDCGERFHCIEGSRCVDYCCEPDDCCIAGSCSEESYCDRTTCEARSYICGVDAVCHCMVVSATDQLPVDPRDSPTLYLSPGEEIDLAVVVVADGDATRPSMLLATSANDFTVELNDPNVAFQNPQALHLVATNQDSAGQPATVTVTHTQHPSVSCSAQLINLGPTGAPGQVRLFLFDELTGSPIPDVALVLDLKGTATTRSNEPFPGGVGVTNSRGLVTTAPLPVAMRYTISAFHPGYDYLTVAGLNTALSSVRLPLRRREVLAPVAGFDGKISFDVYETEFLAGSARPVKRGLAWSSFPPQQLHDFNTDRLVAGPIPENCAQEPCSNIEVFDQRINDIRLPLQSVFHLGNTTPKATFDVAGIPGRRIVTAIAVELSGGDFTPFLSVYSDAEPYPIARNNHMMAPLLSQFALGFSPDLPLAPVSQPNWQRYRSTSYGDRASMAGLSELFPRLDDKADRPALRPAIPFDRLTVVELAELPNDPLLEGANGTLEELITLSGVQTPGYGFAMLGLGLGFDCSRGICDGSHNLGLCSNGDACVVGGDSCVDASSCGPTYDGVLDGVKLCDYSVDPLENECPAYVLAEVDRGILADGTHAHFSPVAACDLLPGKPLMIYLARSSSMSETHARRGSAVIERREPTSGVEHLDPNRFTPVPALGTFVDRNYQPVPEPRHRLRRITLQRTVDDPASAAAIRWHMVFPGDEQTPLRLPQPVDANGASLPDPLSTPSRSVLNPPPITSNAPLEICTLAIELDSSTTFINRITRAPAGLADLWSDTVGFALHCDTIER